MKIFNNGILTINTINKLQHFLQNQSIFKKFLVD